LRRKVAIKRVKSYLTADEVVRKWIEEWLFHYKVRVPRAPPPKELIKLSEELAREEVGE